MEAIPTSPIRRQKVVYMDGENVEERSNILGFGASGEVKLATKMGDNKLYAIKVFHDIAMDEISRLENSSEMSVDIETNDAPSSVEHSLGHMKALIFSNYQLECGV